MKAGHPSKLCAGQRKELQERFRYGVTIRQLEEALADMRITYCVTRLWSLRKDLGVPLIHASGWNWRKNGN